jgi:hypothetical protein
VAHSQQSERVRRLGGLMGIVDGPLGQVYVTALLDELRKLGWTDGRNVSINIRFAAGSADQTPIHGGSMTMASVGSAVQSACRKVRDDAIARGGANDLVDARRRIAQPIEAMADVKPGDESQRLSMHAFGAVFVEVAVDPDLGETPP